MGRLFRDTRKSFLDESQCHLNHTSNIKKTYGYNAPEEIREARAMATDNDYRGEFQFRVVRQTIQTTSSGRGRKDQFHELNKTPPPPHV